MITKKAGTVLINLETKKVALVYRKDTGDFAFPKGHWENGETLQECAIRETEEETGRKNHLVDEKEIYVVKYSTLKGEDVELYMYLAVDDGLTDKVIPEEDTEKWEWFNIDEVEKKVDFKNLKDFWRVAAKPKVIEFLGGENG